MNINSTLTKRVKRLLDKYGNDQAPETVGGKSRTISRLKTIENQKAFLKLSKWGKTEKKFMEFLSQQLYFEILSENEVRLSHANVNKIKKDYGKHVYDKYIRTCCRPILGGSKLAGYNSLFNFTAIVIGLYQEALLLKENKEELLNKLNHFFKSYHLAFLKVAKDQLIYRTLTMTDLIDLVKKKLPLKKETSNYSSIYSTAFDFELMPKEPEAASIQNQPRKNLFKTQKISNIFEKLKNLSIEFENNKSIHEFS